MKRKVNQSFNKNKMKKTKILSQANFFCFQENH